MTDAPERIWAEPGMPGYTCEKNDCYTVEYVRADLAAIVKPLEWIECEDGTFHDPNCRYELETDGGFWRVTKGVTGGGSYVCDAGSLEAAKDAAQADFARRSLSAITLTSASQAREEGRQAGLREAVKVAIDCRPDRPLAARAKAGQIEAELSALLDKPQEEG